MWKLFPLASLVISEDQKRFRNLISRKFNLGPERGISVALNGKNSPGTYQQTPELAPVVCLSDSKSCRWLRVLCLETPELKESQA